MSGSTSQVVAVLGASGLIGRTLARRLSAAGHAVRGASRGPGEYRTLEAMAGDLAGVDLRFGDLTTRSFAREVVGGASVVVCAAGSSGVAASIADPATTMHGTVDLWDSVASEVVPDTTVILMSSQLVYGPSRGTVFTEDGQPAPVSPYAQNLAWIERDGLGRAYKGQMRFLSLRLTNVFGDVLWIEKPRTHGIVALMLRDLLLSGRITLLGGGAQTVNLLHVDDLADAVARVIEARGRDMREVFNVRGSSFPVRLVAEALRAGAQAGELVSEPWPTGMERAVASNIELDDSRFRRQFGWAPSRPVLEEIQRIARSSASVARA